MTVVPRNGVLRWEIADVALEVRCRGAACPVAWLGLFPAFAVSDDGMKPPDIVLDVDPIVGWENPRQLPPRASAWWSTRTAAGVLLEGPYYSGVMQQKEGYLRGKVTADGAGPYSLVAALRALLSHWVLGRGMLLHASGVLRNGRLWLFAGDSNAGKTTIARELNGGGVPFAVDRVALLREGLSPQAHPTPFSDLGGEVAQCVPAVPEAVVIVEQGDAHALRLLAPASAATMLIRHSTWNWKSQAVMSTALETAGWMADRVPVHAMTFSKDEGFWRLLDATTRDAGVVRKGVLHD